MKVKSNIPMAEMFWGQRYVKANKTTSELQTYLRVGQTDLASRYQPQVCSMQTSRTEA